MAEVNREQTVLALLQSLPTRKMEALKELFWTQLSYQHQDNPIPTRGWSDELLAVCETLPLLFASAGTVDDFSIIYTHLSGELRLTDERQLISKMIQQYPFGLFIFSNRAKTHWHFVNVKYEKTEDHSKRRVFRRITISPDERLRTATERVAMLDLAVIADGGFPNMLSSLFIQNAHDKAFDVEKVTDDFFKNYTKIFRGFQDVLQEQTGDPSWAHDYALQFLNRLLFLYYIQRKRWLGGEPEFLRELWREYSRSDHEENSFVSQWLQVLFFEAFNDQFFEKPHFSEAINQAFSGAPYLNGGLFEKNNLDREYDVIIRDDAFKKIFNFLEGYNFTISEDTPLDQEVAVDPEMIGRVYESLVNISEDTSEQKDAGIFYTPRVEIDLMCRLALVDWLKNHLGDDQQALLYQWVFAFTHEDKEQADNEIKKFNLWPKLTELLEEITVLDPACGSGSFLVGMLYILNDLLLRIDSNLGDDRTPYQRKKAIVGSSLYGVDIKSWAVHIAELRLWLQLVVETRMIPAELQFKPLLPNLSFKVRVGDSLVQEVGGIDLNLNRARGQHARELGGRLTQLKAEKMKFFHNDPDRRYHSVDAIKHEERRLFRDMLAAQIQAKQNRCKELTTQLENQTDLFGKVTDPQLTLDRPQAEREIEKLQAELEALKSAKVELDQREQVPFVWDIAFVEMFEGKKQGFDLVVGNPPYLRQEDIHDPTMDSEEIDAAAKSEYKDKLEASVYAAWPKTFQYNPRENTSNWTLSRKSDYYIYFYFHGLSLLNKKGSFCFITSNSWLDVGYGEDLQKFLLTRGKIHFIIDNESQRSFTRADINTVIILLGPPKDLKQPNTESHDQKARFVMFKVPFDQVLSPIIWQELIEKGSGRFSMDEYRLMVKNQQTLYHNGLNKETAKYEADKWGGKYLRAPDIYWSIMEKVGSKLVRLGDIAEVRRGITTGANDFFYLDREKISRWQIEKEFLKPIIKSPRECMGFVLNDINALNFHLFYCHQPKSQLKGTNALKYILNGEKFGYQKRPSTRGRKYWYDVGKRNIALLITPSSISYISRMFLNEINVLCDKRLYEIYPNPKVNNQKLAAFLNSTFTSLFLQVNVRTGLGEGLLDMTVYEFEDCLIPNPDLIPDSILIPFNEMKKREILNLEDELKSSDRRALDEIIFNEFELSNDEINEFYLNLSSMIKTRITKAESV